MARSAGDRVERGAAPLSTQGSRGARLLERGSQRGVPFGLRCRSRRALTREFHRGARPPLGRGAWGGTPLPSRAGIEAGPSPPERAAHYRAWLAFLRNGTSSYRRLKINAAIYRQQLQIEGKVGQLPSAPAICSAVLNLAQICSAEYITRENTFIPTPTACPGHKNGESTLRRSYHRYVAVQQCSAGGRRSVFYRAETVTTAA